MISCLLWDLDGTLTSSHVGIVRCIQYALERSQLHVPEEKDLLWCIGPPLSESFAKLAPGNDPASLVALYRERFATKGLFENSLVPGVKDVLENMNGWRHFVATSKPEKYAREIISHFGLSKRFEQIYGSAMNGERSNKEDLLKYLLASEGLDPRETLMIGDREHDVYGATGAGLNCIGVLWGYGSEEELKTAGAKHIVPSPHDLALLLQEMAKNA